jgi:hypothetical protein
MSAMADAKMKADPTMLPKVAWRRRQKGTATRRATAGGAVAASAIQDQLSSFTRRRLYNHSPPRAETIERGLRQRAAPAETCSALRKLPVQAGDR